MYSLKDITSPCSAAGLLVFWIDDKMEGASRAVEGKCYAGVLLEDLPSHWFEEGAISAATKVSCWLEVLKVHGQPGLAAADRDK